MSTNLLPTPSLVIRDSVNSDNIPRKTSAGKWWTPLFGWSSDPDYIDSRDETQIKSENTSAKPKFTPGVFTEEKAKQLRMMTKETTSFHDVMYHSAIASRLATDFSGKSSSDEK
ncbi:uncharacterized protein LOC130814874 [Amaranthus tricolor]|uniref:uncharacterized protein LOC130814874 n=1 Tax=Amaranthus tricolor TaxID=29722 RepID=UPI00258BD590|nr:uncharacterized protein LOC130814874 [Amaranthus tricolor]